MTLDAAGAIATGEINTSGLQSGGEIRLASQSNIQTTGNLNSASSGGNAGNVTLDAAGDVSLGGDILSIGEVTAGREDIGTTGGNINLGSSNIEAFSQNGAGGDVTLNAAGSVTTSNITTFGNTASGNVTISSAENAIEIVTIQTNAEESAPSGSVTLNTFTAEGNIQSANIAADETGEPTGNVEVVAPDGSTRIENVGESNVEPTPTPTGEEDSPASTPTPTGEDSPQLQPESSPTSNETFVQSVQNNNEVATAVSGESSNTTSNSHGNFTNAKTSDSEIIIYNNSKNRDDVPGSSQASSILQTNLSNVNGPTFSVSQQTIAQIEQARTSDFYNYFGGQFSTRTLSTKSVRDILSDIAKQTENQSAVIYVTAYANELQLILFTPSGDAILKTIPQGNREELIKVVKKFREEITKGKNPIFRNSNNYLSAAQQLYQWLIVPIEAELEAAKIETLLFSMDEGLRGMPVAALHNGEQFLVEKYSLSLIPSVSLMDTRYRSLQDTRVLAMGASQFLSQPPLPAVPLELQTITQQVWRGSLFLNQEFTLNNLLEQRRGYSYPIIHLATHAEFQPGDASNSYIQFWEGQQLRLSQVRRLGLDNPAVELLVLSACRTAVGDSNAELGFAGLAVATGVKSALASLWYVSDEGTLGLMTEFYSNLNDVKIKAQALRQAQIAMLRGEVEIMDGFLLGLSTRGGLPLPPELAGTENTDLSHPYYWSGFTLIGSPW